MEADHVRKGGAEVKPYSEMTLAEIEEHLGCQPGLPMSDDDSAPEWLAFRRGEKAGIEVAVPKFITDVFGERCAGFDPFCHCCVAWREWDDYRALLNQEQSR